MSAGGESADWTTGESAELYGVGSWGADFFSVNDRGHVAVRPHGEAKGPEVDLLDLVEDLRHRGLRTPLLIRFSDAVASRVADIAGAFANAIESYEYSGRYRGVYPIKVNQQRHLVEEVVQYGASLGVGLEAGSKPELLIALALLDTADAFIICNGYKDRAYVETALLGQRLGRTPVIVVDRYHELELIIKIANELGIRPHIGMRARLVARGSGRWTESTGRRSKFGLAPDEIVSAVGRLRSEGMLECLELLHIHIGSQIAAIRTHKDALREVSRIYVGLHEMGADKLRVLDLGGGLAVDYDGSNSDTHSSMNYSMQEYANDVVGAIQEACDDAEVPHPDLVTESGRAMVAHHAVLVFDVLGVTEVLRGAQAPDVREDDPKVLHDLKEVWSGLTPENVQERYHDLLQIREEAASLFALGYLNLHDRALVERHDLFCCERILEAARSLDSQPDDLQKLEKSLADTYYGNFSVFQSAPDHWAVSQIFPVMPIHRLDERPSRRGIFADLTCDSDGKIDQFIGAGGAKDILELHPPNGQPYYMGVFLLGAYQEILGDLHNLFGDTDAVHVRLDEDGHYLIEHVVEGDTVGDVLRYVQYEPSILIEKVRRTIERALRRGDISLEDSARLRRRYEQGLRDYTYLCKDE